MYLWNLPSLRRCSHGRARCKKNMSPLRNRWGTFQTIPARHTMKLLFLLKMPFWVGVSDFKDHRWRTGDAQLAFWHFCLWVFCNWVGWLPFEFAPYIWWWTFAREWLALRLRLLADVYSLKEELQHLTTYHNWSCFCWVSKMLCQHPLPQRLYEVCLNASMLHQHVELACCVAQWFPAVVHKLLLFDSSPLWL